MSVLKLIPAYLETIRENHPAPDLLDRYLEHGTAMETQANVAADDGKPVEGRRNTWTNGLEEWWNIRIPKGAMSDPYFHDYTVRFDFPGHIEAIGSTGWDWENKVSRWVGFDFDSLTGHAAGVGISDEELARVRVAATEIPYVEVRKSTGGKGLHLYVLLDAIPTSNHTEHAALARSVLEMMSAEVGFDFARAVDCCGSILWVWHRRQAADGFQVISPAESVLSVDDLPVNWRDQVDVVSKRRGKIKVRGLSDKEEDIFDQLASARPSVELDDVHKATIDALTNSGFSTVWISDYHLVQTHTCAFAKLMEDPKTKAKLGLNGFYRTSSEGNDPATPNCFAFPLPNGGWKICRFGLGSSEDRLWSQKKGEWTTCHFNVDPNYHTAARAIGGVELENNKGYQFDKFAPVSEVVEALGDTISIEEKYTQRETIILPNKDGRLVVRVSREKEDPKPEGWGTYQKGWWQQIVGVSTETAEDESGITNYDNDIRRLRSLEGGEGWYLRDTHGWGDTGVSTCQKWLISEGHNRVEADAVLGKLAKDCWKLVSLPFQPEYPGDRQWNSNAPAFRFQATDVDEPKHPHWDMLLEHCFCDLDEALKENDWAKESNIRNGYQYGLAWVACCFRQPFEPLPFLFLFGEQNAGKSMLHEALAQLVTRGVVSADRSLTNNSDHNGELANGVIAYVEERNIAGSPHAYDRLKDWVTAKTMWIRKMRTDAYPQPNTLHFVMCANERKNCPVVKGDTRITMIHVPPLEKSIPKQIFQQRLEEEAPHFMTTLMRLELPRVVDRLRIPVIETETKREAMGSNSNAVKDFINKKCHRADGHKVRFDEFLKRFRESLPEDQRHRWDSENVKKALPDEHPHGRNNNSKRYVGNLSFGPVEVSVDAVPFVLRHGRLVPFGD